MKFFQWQRKGQKLLSNKIIQSLVLFLVFTLIFGCGKTEQKKVEEQPVKNFNDPSVMLQESQKVLGKSAKTAYSGTFEDKTKNEIVAGLEIDTKDELGIKFALLKIVGNKLEKGFETALLDGSITDGYTSKINLPPTDYELLYYNSQDYYVGSGGGEVFSYLIDFKLKKVYYAHLIIEPKTISLFLSENIDNQEIKDFFIKNFRKDYPSLTLVSKDFILD